MCVFELDQMPNRSKKLKRNDFDTVSLRSSVVKVRTEAIARPLPASGTPDGTPVTSFCPGASVVGGAEEIRTPDLRRARAALSQLSYGPPILEPPPACHLLCGDELPVSTGAC